MNSSFEVVGPMVGGGHRLKNICVNNLLFLQKEWVAESASSLESITINK